MNRNKAAEICNRVFEVFHEEGLSDEITASLLMNCFLTICDNLNLPPEKFDSNLEVVKDLYKKAKEQTDD